MNDDFDAETLRLLDETREVRIETHRDVDSPEHRTIIWVVVVEGEAMVRPETLPTTLKLSPA